MTSPTSAISTSRPMARAGGGRAKFLIGFGLIIAAIIYLVASNTMNTAQYFFTVQELKDKGAAMTGRSVRISGAVVGDSITYDSKALTLKFIIANVTNDLKQVEAQGGLAKVLHAATVDPNAARMTVVYVGPKPDLMKGEAQAIVEGHVDKDGVFYADTLLLKCPTRYEAVPAQAAK
jgi:cytochrome c-type biogenesis protein CcmE